MARSVDVVLLGPKKGIQGRESMAKLRMILSMVALVAVSSVAGPSAASASPLLSGYGGPGQGNQAILGSALLNGPGGGGGSGGGSSGAPDLTASSPPDVASKGAGAQVGGRPVGASRSAVTRNVSATGRTGKDGSSGRKSTGAGPADGVAGPGDTGHASDGAFSVYPASEQSAGEGVIWGLSGEDLGCILLALGTLALTAVLTRYLTRSADIEGGKTYGS
jgi:hypothetical protein